MVRKGAGEGTIVGYDVARSELFVNRVGSGQAEFHPAFAGKHKGPLEPKDGRVSLHLFIDDSSIEVFGNDGETVITNRIFPSPDSNGVELYSVGSTTEATSIQSWSLRSIWKE